MITQVKLSHFKRFGAEEIIDLNGDFVLLAGPNNSGKSTVLQAISAWNLALQRWLAERAQRPSQKRLSLTLDEFTAVPTREMNLLWENRRTAVGRKTTKGKNTSEARPIIITLSGLTPQAEPWQLGMEFTYASPKLIYARPVQPQNSSGPSPAIPAGARQASIVLIPPLSGLETEEPLWDRGIRQRLIGQGRAGEIVRNLLWDLWQQPDKNLWLALVNDVQRFFQYELLPPVYGPAQPFIECEYRPITRSGRRASKLDIANAGSGFHQVLLLLAFFYTWPATTLLVDEPDAHLHFVLQREVFNHLRAVAAERGCQLIAATHAEALLDQADPTCIRSFFHKPHRLQTRQQVTQLRDALLRLSSTDLLQADHAGAVLYMEDEAEARILKEWANILQHPARQFFRLPYLCFIGAGGDLREAKRHFAALRMAYPEVGGICLLNGENSGAASADAPEGMRVLLWRRREIENYLLNPGVLKRYVAESYQRARPNQPTLEEAYIDSEFARQGLSELDYLGEEVPPLRNLAAGQFLLDLLGKTYRRATRRDLYLVARVMRPEEVHPEIIEKLDALVAILPSTHLKLLPEETREEDEASA